MKTVLEFGKIAFNGTRKINKVTLEIELRESEKKQVFSASVNIWNSRETDILMCGECVDLVYNDYNMQLSNRVLYMEVMELWQKYHLNDTYPDCVHDINANKLKNGYTNTQVCGEPCPICGYKYGSAWNYRPIPEMDINRIKEIIINGK